MNPFAAFVLTLCAGVCSLSCANAAPGSGEGADRRRQEQPRADSPSAILRARHIVLLTIVLFEEGPWQPAPRGGQTQALRIVARVGETLSGLTVAAGPGGSVTLSATRSRPGPRDSVAPGVWSAIELQSGARLVLLSQSVSIDPAQALAEAALIRVLPAEPAAEEIRRVLRLHRSPASLGDALRRVTEPPALSLLFAEYLAARLQDGVQSGDKTSFDAAMTWIEQPGRSAAVQTFIVGALTTRMLSQPPQRSGFDERLALAQWRLLASTNDEELASQIESTWLPNLLGLEGAATPVGVQAVFGKDLAEAKRIAEALRRRPETAGRARLLQWLSV